MKNSLLIAIREWKERVGSRSFLLFSVLGPMVVLALIYMLFVFGGESKQHWNVLIADPTGILKDRVLNDDDQNISYSFADNYIKSEEFRDAKKFQGFDAMLEINEQILYTKVSHVFYRQKPSAQMEKSVQYHIERRLEEVMVDRFADFSIQEYLKIKQPLNLGFRDVYDPEGQKSDLEGWVGFFYGIIIFVFVFLFGMTILRSVSREKSNRIVEVLLASVSPNQLMLGKIIGIGLSALVQFLIWAVIIGAGLFLMRETLFPDMLNAANLNVQDLGIEAANQSYGEQYFSAREYNQFVELVYNRVRFSVILPFFLLFFIGGYFFYGALFASVGATMGSESDGQQFVLPIIIMLILALYSGYYVLNYPESPMAGFLQYLPFTSPVVVMVKLAQGYEHGYEIYVSLLILFISAFAMLAVASRLYKNGILQFGHRVRIKHIFKWLRKT